MKWIDAIRGKIEKCRMDSMFQILIEDRLNEIYILEDWGKVEDDLVFDWINTLKSGAPDGAGGFLPVCPFNRANLWWSGKMIIDSIKLDLWDEIGTDVSYDTTGPELFMEIILHQQQLEDLAICNLVDQLKRLKLSKEPTQKVETHIKKVTELAQQIEGSRAAPRDLTSLVEQTFLGAEVVRFNMGANRLHMLAD